MSKHLHRRGDSFQYRRVFPADVRATAGRRELTKSLKVKTLKEAELEAALWDVEFDKIVATARGTGQPSEATAIVLATRMLEQAGLLTQNGFLGLIPANQNMIRSRNNSPLFGTGKSGMR